MDDSAWPLAGLDGSQLERRLLQAVLDALAEARKEHTALVLDVREECRATRAAVAQLRDEVLSFVATGMQVRSRCGAFRQPPLTHASRWPTACPSM